MSKGLIISFLILTIIFTAFFTLFILFLKFLPAVAISEVKGVMPQADPHWEGYSHKEAH